MTAALIALTLATALLAHRVNGLHDHLVEHLDRQIRHLEGVIMSAQQEALDTLVAQVRKGTAEVVGRIAALQADIDAGVAAEDLDLSGLSAAAQALDDVVVDEVVAPADTPVE